MPLSEPIASGALTDIAWATGNENVLPPDLSGLSKQIGIFSTDPVFNELFVAGGSSLSVRKSGNYRFEFYTACTISQPPANVQLPVSVFGPNYTHIRAYSVNFGTPVVKGFLTDRFIPHLEPSINEYVLDAGVSNIGPVFLDANGSLIPGVPDSIQIYWAQFVYTAIAPGSNGTMFWNVKISRWD